MRNIKQLIAASILAGCLSTGFTACSDFLEQPALGKENMDTYFQTEAECIKHVNGCYESLHWEDWWEIRMYILTFNMCTDDMWMGNTTQDQSGHRDLAHYTGNAQTDIPHNFWQYRYKGILRSNVCILRIPESPIADEDLKKRLVAEAKMIRAFHYFDLVRNFGGVPIVTGFHLPDEIEGITRSSVEDVYELIEQDLKDAIADLPLRSEYSAANLGRATKGAAQAYLGKVYLYQDKHELAEPVLNEVITSGEYRLLNDFGDVWSVEYNNSEEGLFEVQNVFAGTTYKLGCSLGVISGSRNDPGDGWSWGLPTSNLEKAFIDAGDTERLRWTIIKNGATEIAGDPDAEDIDGFLPFVIKPDEHKSPRVNRKYYIPVRHRTTADGGNIYGTTRLPLNYRLLRYADVLLMQAEVKNALGKDGDAREYLKMVRDRVGLPEVTSSGTALRDAIRLERRLELALENERLYDLRRWTDDNGKKAIANIMGPEGSFVRYNLYESEDEDEKSNQKEASNKGYYFNENRDLLFPIPYAEVAKSNGAIEQNPNYN